MYKPIPATVSRSQKMNFFLWNESSRIAATRAKFKDNNEMHKEYAKTLSANTITYTLNCLFTQDN